MNILWISQISMLILVFCKWMWMKKREKTKKKRNQINNKMAWGHKFCFIKINMLLMNAKRELQTIGQISCMLYTQMFRFMIILYDLCAILANKILFFFIQINGMYAWMVYCVRAIICVSNFVWPNQFCRKNRKYVVNGIWMLDMACAVHKI